MGWPTPQDYNEAIQNPQFCFSDPELKQGTPALTTLGLPKPISGAFASVYRVNCQNRSWAVRCFLREFADQERRYSAISDRLRAAQLPCMVGFEFLARGILIRGRWYPILKMEWIDGEPISEYISRNLNQRQVLQSLSRQWIDLMASLRKAQIAHGDLQHGNILASDGVLKLIDYDAMYVPALAGLESHEEGHRNYQHPGRTGRDFHPDLDNFSAWVIFTSISALATDTRFWDLLNAGDECLLFRREDFEKPRTSKVLQTLEKHGNIQLQTLVSHFRSILNLPISQIPSLDGSVFAQPTEPQGLPGWLGDHLDQQKQQPHLEPLDAGASRTPISGAEWLYDHLIDDSTKVQPRPPLIQRRDRVALWSFLGVLGVMVVAWAVSLVSSLVFTAIVLLALIATSSILVVGYGATNPTAKRAAIRKRLKAGRARVAEIEGVINLSNLERARLGEPLVKLRTMYDKLPQMMNAKAEQLDRSLARMLEGIEARRRKAQNDHEAAIRAMDAEAEQLERSLVRTLERIEARRRKAKQDEETAIRQLEDRVQTTVGYLVLKRGSLASEEKVEIDRVLQKSRSLHVRLALSQARLTASDVSGIGEALAERLRAAGVSCASEVTYDRVRKVPGIGEAKANALVEWSRGIERQADSTAPSSLSQTEASRIRREYASSCQSIDEQIASSKEEERKECQQILQRFAASRRSWDAEEESAKRDFDLQRDALRVKSGKERQRLAAELISVQQTLNAEEEVAKRGHRLQMDALKARFDKERDSLAAEYKAEKMRAYDARNKLDEKFDQFNQSLFQRRLEVRQDELELVRHKDIDPMRYLRLVLLSRRIV